jgi:signal transduction histidine kinase
MKASAKLTERLWLLPALGILALIVGAGVFLLWGAATHGSLSDLTGRILEEDTDNSAEQGGLQVGDVLLSLNDTPPMMWDGFRHPLYRPGDVATVTFQRGDEVYTTTVPAELVPERRWLAQLLILAVALAFCLLSLVVLLSRPQAVETRQFYLMCQAWAGVLTLGALSTVGVHAASRWLGLLTGLLTPTMVHFHTVFPEKSWLGQRRRPVMVVYGAGAVLATLFFLGPVLPLRQATSAAQTGMYAWLLLGLAVAIGLVVASYVTTSSPYARRRIRLVVFGTVLAFGPFGLLTAAPIVLFGGATWDSWMLTIPLMSALPIVYAVALWQYNLMGFDRVLNRGLVYLVVSAVVFGTYFVALTGFYALLPLNRVSSAALGAAVAVVAAATFRPLRAWVQRRVDRLFYGGWYDYRELMAEVGHALARTLDPETLVRVLVQQVPQAMHLPGAALWLEHNGKMEFLGYSGVAIERTQAWIGGNGAARREEITVDGDHALVPLVVKDQVVGMWGLAARLSEEWGPEDRDILAALSQHAALAAQNVRLVGALRTKVAEVEEIHRRLLAAREDERAYIARELHDGVIQDLIGLRYRLETVQEDTKDSGEQVGELYAQVGLLIDELRRLCSDLRPLALDQLGLAAALRALVREITARGLRVEADLEEISLPDSVAIGLYRIGREALSNTWRHADASRALIALARDQDEVVLTVADDGRGFIPATSYGRDGCLGLLGMSERAEALGGHLVVESAPGQGTQVTVRCDLRTQPSWLSIPQPPSVVGSRSLGLFRQVSHLAPKSQIPSL